MGIAVVCSSVHKVFVTCTHARFYAYSIHKKIVDVVDDDDIFLRDVHRCGYVPYEWSCKQE